MILSLYDRVAVKAGEERYEFDRRGLMFSEVCEIEKVTGLSFWEWQEQLNRYSMLALGGLLHMLRKRADVPSDFASMDFRTADFDVVPLHEDGSEYTAEEVAADITARMEAANADPTSPPPADGENAPPATTASTSPISPNGSTSDRGSGNGSPGGSSRSSKRAPTPS